jgi:hypothetical protein
VADIEAIKSRIRKLMAYANDGAASEGEIENAMRHAAALLDKHHLSESDIPTEEDERELTMGRAAATSQSTKFSTWEAMLSSAITNLFGCVGHYISYETAPQRINGIAVMDGGAVKKGRRLYYYGPETEAREAAALFEEWARSIATMGVARWGGCFRGDGAMYCYGFAKALQQKSLEINDDRKLIAAKALPGTGGKAIVLADRYTALQKQAKDWLADTLHITLSKGSRGSGYGSGSHDAFKEGSEHGRAAQFSRPSVRKQLPQ